MFAFSDKEWPGLAKLVEESGELTEILPMVLLLKAVGKLTQTNGKIMMLQGGTDHWSGNLRKAMLEEMADVEAALIFVATNNLTKREQNSIAARVAKKLNKFERWHAGNEVKKRVAKNRSKARVAHVERMTTHRRTTKRV